jgi:hypothetical protein
MMICVGRLVAVDTSRRELQSGRALGIHISAKNKIRAGQFFLYGDVAWPVNLPTLIILPIEILGTEILGTEILGTEILGTVILPYSSTLFCHFVGVLGLAGSTPFAPEIPQTPLLQGFGGRQSRGSPLFLRHTFTNYVVYHDGRISLTLF